jgi:hypothetical protein
VEPRSMSASQAENGDSANMPTPVVLKSGFQTSEFATMAGTIIANLIGLFVLSGKLPAGDQARVTEMVVGLVVAGGAFAANAVAAWRYIQSREAVKTSFLGAINATPQAFKGTGRSGRAIRI